MKRALALGRPSLRARIARHYRDAIALKAENAVAHMNLATVLLTGFDFIAGFREAEWRLKLPGVDLSTLPAPRWRGEPLAGRRLEPPGPVVIWNLIRRCNLTCKHCYSISADTDFAGTVDLAGWSLAGGIMAGAAPRFTRTPGGTAAGARSVRPAAVGDWSALGSNGPGTGEIGRAHV